MKVAVTCRFLGGRLEGIGHYTHEILSRMVMTHPEVEWDLLYDRNDNRIFYNQPNVTAHIIGPPTRHPWLVRYWLEKKVRRKLEKIKPDVIWYPDSFVCLSTNVPSLQTVHDLAYIEYPQGSRKRDLRFYNRWMQRFCRYTDHIITVSNYAKRSLARHLDIPNDKITTVYNGLDSNFKPIPLDKKKSFQNQYSGSKPYLLVLGAIHPRKNVISAIKGFEHYKEHTESDVKLIIAGRYAWKYAEVKKAIQYSPHVKDIIHLSDIEDIRYDLVACADAMLYLSLSEGFGLPVLEALACHIPVITSQDSAMEEVGGDALMTCNPLQINDIASAIKKVLTDHDLHHKLVQNGKKRSPLFSWDVSSGDVFSNLEKLAANR